MVIGFKPQFKQKILDGIKIHTIRDDKGNRWVAGKKMHMATGVRTKKYTCFKVATCTGYQWIYIYKKTVKVTYSENGKCKVALDEDEIKELAINDGFDTVDQFFNWFAQKPYQHRRKLIHWTDFSYTPLPF